MKYLNDSEKFVASLYTFFENQGYKLQELRFGEKDEPYAIAITKEIEFENFTNSLKQHLVKKATENPQQQEHNALMLSLIDFALGGEYGGVVTNVLFEISDFECKSFCDILEHKNLTPEYREFMANQEFGKEYLNDLDSLDDATHSIDENIIS